MKPTEETFNSGPYLLTGATGAIGKEIADYIASQGIDLILACRNTAKAEELRKELHAKYPHCKRIDVVRLDLSDENSVRTCVNDINELLLRCIVHPTEKEELWFPIRLRGIINNAGVMNRRYAVDNQGRELTMAVNYSNTMLLNELLKNKVNSGGVIVFTTSLTRFLHRRTDYPVSFPEKQFSQLGTYGKSKRMITEYAGRLAKELKSEDIRVNCADPGIVDTGMIRMDRWYDRLADIFFRPFIRSPHHGAVPAIRAMESPLTAHIFCRHRTHHITD